MVEGLEKSILIQGRQNLNRALHDDMVAIELLPEEDWSTPSTVVLDKEKQEEEKEGMTLDMLKEDTLGGEMLG